MENDNDDEWVIHVLEHKTTGAFGPAKVAVSHDICLLMEEYFLHIQGKITPKHQMFEKRFFNKHWERILQNWRLNEGYC